MQKLVWFFNSVKTLNLIFSKLWFCGIVHKYLFKPYRGTCGLKYKTVNMNSTTACTPNSGWCPIRIYIPVTCSEFDYFSDNFLKLACRSLQVYLKKEFLFWCSFSAFNKNFPQCPRLICVKLFHLILPRSLFTPTDLRNCFRIVFLMYLIYFFTFPLPVLLIWNFLICHLGVRIPVPDKWVFLRSS